MLFSTSYFPPIPYIQAFSRYSTIILDNYEYYEKQTWRNRMMILSGNGALKLTVPVSRPNGKKTIIKDIVIDSSIEWKKDHWKAIESAYQHAPYFFYYGEQVKELIYTEKTNLVAFNTFILQHILNWLDLPIKITHSTHFESYSNLDYRLTLNQKKFNCKQKSYIQVFSDKLDFEPNLSILDLIMNEGPLARNFIVL